MNDRNSRLIDYGLTLATACILAINCFFLLFLKTIVNILVYLLFIIFVFNLNIALISILPT